MSDDNKTKAEYEIVLVKCSKCGKITPHEVFEYYIDDDSTTGEPAICVKHYRCLNCGHESEIEFNIQELDIDEEDTI